MDYQARIVELLDIYLERNESLKRSYKENITNKDLYEELLRILRSDEEQIIDDSNRVMISILLNTIYKNNIYSQFYSALLDKTMNSKEEKLSEFIAMIMSDYNKLLSKIDKQLKRIERNKNLVSAANKAKLAFKQGRPIIDSRYDITFIKRILSYFEIEGEISNKEELFLINEIELYNRKLASKSGNAKEKEKTEELYQQIPNILNAGYEVYPEIKVSEDRRNTLNGFVKQILVFINSLEEEDIIRSIENYRMYDITDEEYKYIITEILNNYINEMIEYYNLILDKELYASVGDRKEIIKD